MGRCSKGRAWYRLGWSRVGKSVVRILCNNQDAFINKRKVNDRLR